MSTYFVPGIPRPQGSKGHAIRGGRVHLFEASKKLPEWRKKISKAVADASKPLMLGPVYVWLTFLMPRPAADYDSKGNLKPKAPLLPSKRPDVDKLARACLDAMTGVVYKDDSQVVNLLADKVYSGELDALGDQIVGVEITIGAMERRQAA